MRARLARPGLLLLGVVCLTALVTGVVVSSGSGDTDGTDRSVGTLGTPSLSGLDIAGQGPEAVVPPSEGGDGGLEPGDEVTVDLDNVGFSAWAVNGVSGATEDIGDVVVADVDNPTLTLVKGVTYTFENLPGSAHPLRLFDAQGSPLLSQDEQGSFEDDPAVGWSDTGDTVTFTLTSALATALDGYVCTIHSNMEGEAQTSEGSVVPGGGDNVTVNVTNVGTQSGSFDVNLSIGTNVSVTASTGSLGVGDTETVVFENVTGGLDVSAGPYPVTVSAGADSTSGTLGVYPDVLGDGAPATDTTGDGRLNDVDGDRTFDVFDVQALFGNYQRTLLQENTPLFDFDGDDALDIFDVQTLFDSL